jgi:hypothetical protein
MNNAHLILIPHEKSDIGLYTSSGLHVANSYERVVFGGKGPYVEFEKSQVLHRSFYIPPTQLFRLSDPKIYYVEYRSNDVDNVEMRYQLRSLKYADYKLGYFYISLVDLYDIDGNPSVKSSDDVNYNFENFFA